MYKTELHPCVVTVEEVRGRSTYPRPCKSSSTQTKYHVRARSKVKSKAAIWMVLLEAAHCTIAALRVEHVVKRAHQCICARVNVPLTAYGPLVPLGWHQEQPQIQE